MFSLLLLIAATSSAAQVQTRDMRSPDDDGKWRKIGIQISNPGSDSISLDSAQIQYVLRERTDSLTTTVWYFQDHSSNWSYNVQGVSWILASIQRQDDSTRILSLRFQPGINLPGGGRLEIQLGVHRSDYSVIDQSRDPSYLPTAVYQNNPNVVFVLGSAYTAWKDTTIAGQDRDGNGVRDDLDAIIRQAYPGNDALQNTISKTVRLQDSLLLLASADTASLVDLDYRLMTTAYCFLVQAAAQGFDSDSIRAVNEELFANQINTIERLRAYANSQQKIGPQVFKFPDDTDLTTFCAESWR